MKRLKTRKGERRGRKNEKMKFYNYYSVYTTNNRLFLIQDLFYGSHITDRVSKTFYKGLVDLNVCFLNVCTKRSRQLIIKLRLKNICNLYDKN